MRFVSLTDQLTFPELRVYAKYQDTMEIWDDNFNEGFNREALLELIEEIKDGLR